MSAQSSEDSSRIWTLYWQVWDNPPSILSLSFTRNTQIGWNYDGENNAEPNSIIKADGNPSSEMLCAILCPNPPPPPPKKKVKNLQKQKQKSSTGKRNGIWKYLYIGKEQE